MTCYSYHTEILDPQDAKCLCSKEFIVLEKCRVLFTGEIHLNKENFPLIWTILSELFNFRFEIDMATLNNAFQNQRQRRNDIFFIRIAHLTLTFSCLKDAEKTYQTTQKHACSSKFPDLVQTEITVTFLNLTTRADN